MDPTLLRSFVAIARQGHLGRAAAELRLCKPAISSHLKEMERTAEQPLFFRSANGMRLTPAGDRLLPLVQRALDALEEITMAARNPGGRLTGHADLGLIGDAVWLRVPQVLGFLQRHHPDLAVHLRQCASGQVQRDVLEGRLTAGWVLGPVDGPGLAVQTLATVRLRVVGPRAWARQLETASLRELADFPWVDTTDRCAFTLQRQVLFAQTGHPPIGRFHADSERTSYGIVAEGLAVSLLREDLALAGQEAGDLALWSGQVPGLHLRFVLPTIRRDEPIGRALIDAVARSWEPARPKARHRGQPRE